jgi:putative chitinase
LNEYADKDDVLTITKRINGGTNGLEERKAVLNTAKGILK